MRHTIFFLCLFLSSSFPFMPALASNEGDVSVYYRYPLHHTGYYPINAAPSLEKKYGLINVGMHTASKSSPVIVDTVVYVGSDAGYMYALDETTLNVLWRFKVRPTANHGIHGTAAVKNDLLFIGAYDGYLYAIDRFTGRLLDQIKLGDYIGSSPVIWNNRLYIGVETSKPDGYLACIDLETYRHCFDKYMLGGHIHSTPTTDEETNTVFIGTNNNCFFAFDAMTGELKWKYETDGDVKSTAAVTGDLVLITSWDNNLYAFDKRKGTVIWKYESAQRSMSSPAIDPEDNRVCFGSHDSSMYCVDLTSGSSIWKYKTRQRIMSSPIITISKQDQRKVLIFGSSDGFIYWLNAQNDSLIYKYQT